LPIRLVVQIKMPGKVSIWVSISLTWVTSHCWLARLRSPRQMLYGFIQQQYGALFFGIGEHGSDIFFAFAHIFAQQVRSAFAVQLQSQTVGEVLGQGGFAGAGCAIKTKAAAWVLFKASQ